MKTKPAGVPPVHPNHSRAIVLLLLLAAGNCVAQDSIDTNRPGFSASPYVVKPGVWQFESGVHYQNDNDGAGLSIFALPLATFRYGLMDEMEVLFDWVGFSRLRSDSGNSTGITDASVGVKFQLTGDEAVTALAFLADFSVPIGEDGLSSDSWDPAIGLAWAHAGRYSLAGTAKLRKSGSDYQLDNGIKMNFVAFANSSGFVEWEANIPDSGGAQHKMNGGMMWWPAPHMQYDINATLGLNDRAPDYALGLGFSYRF